jgi:hypothetical protein
MLRKAPIKRGRKKEPTAMERRHMNRVAAMGCLACGGEAELHHVTGYADRMGRLPRSNQLIAPLCPLHHRGVGEKAPLLVSVQSLNHRGFCREHGIDLYAEAERLWAESDELERRAA